VKNWFPVVRWLSPECIVGRGDVLAVGSDGEDYTWTRIYVGEFRDGLVASVYEFDIEDEYSAFAYAEERMRAATSWLAVSNQAIHILASGLKAMQTRDIPPAAAATFYSDTFAYDDRRRLSGDPIEDHAQSTRLCNASCPSTPTSGGTRSRFGVRRWDWFGATGRTPPGTRRRIWN
jgi:hypothetical protein